MAPGVLVTDLIFWQRKKGRRRHIIKGNSLFELPLIRRDRPESIYRSQTTGFDRYCVPSPAPFSRGMGPGKNVAHACCYTVSDRRPVSYTHLTLPTKRI